MADSGRRTLSGERLGQIIWDLGHFYPIIPGSDQVSISMVHPRLGYLYLDYRFFSREDPL